MAVAGATPGGGALAEGRDHDSTRSGHVKGSQAVIRTTLAVVVLAVGCKGDTTDPGGNDNGNNGSITLSLSQSAVSVLQGANATVTAAVGRSGGFDGAITVLVEGMPAGVTATPSPATVAASGTSSTITLAPGASVAAGNYPITVRARGAGVTDATAVLALTVTAAPEAGFTLAVSPGALSIQQGAQGTATVTLARTNGFTGSVTLASTGQPVGMTVTFDPASTTASTSTATVAVGGSVAAGTHILTLRGTAPGQTERTAALTVTVTSQSAGGNTTSRFCGTQPLWFAFQDGAGPWTRVTPGQSGTYVFNIASGRGGIAFVLSSDGTSSGLTVQYGTQPELNAAGFGCGGSTVVPTKSVNGSVANVGAAEQAWVSLAGSTAFVVPLAGNTFSLTGVLDRPSDLIASRIETSVGAGGITTIMNKGIIRRDQNPANNSTLAVLDFNAAEAFTPVTGNVTINNLSEAMSQVSSGYFTANGSFGLLYQETGGAAGNRQYYGIPANVQRSTDLHVLTVAGMTLQGSALSLRSSTLVFRDVADRTITLGPTLANLAVTSVATTPNARLRAVYPIAAQYGNFWVIAYVQQAGSSGRTVTVQSSQGYLAGATTFDVTIPDFSALADWQTSWGLGSGAVDWVFSAIGWTGASGTFGTPYAEGVVSHTATASGTITP
jgi:hypothetical protein